MDAQELDRLVEQARDSIALATDLEGLKELERKYLGKTGEVTRWLSRLAELPAPERPAFGKAVNERKVRLKALLDGRGDAIEQERLARELQDPLFDSTLPATPHRAGHLHPITQLTREIEDLFVSMGYSIADGPEVETDWYNFAALNIPADHPARDSQDTFYLSDPARLVLRTHTSTVQIRAMQRLRPPLRVIAPGKVFRQEATDASHEHTFHQLEGLVVDRGVSVAHLIYAMKTLLRGIFRKDLEIRLRPGFFPFVEPGFELDARCPFCEQGCGVCKRTRWVELLPCGLVHPNVLRACEIDPEEFSGFAFGLGLSRLVMLRFGIPDVRLLLGSDPRFLEQF
jgi:phenylalanyl-tRNA synthetase alpha chain